MWFTFISPSVLKTQSGVYEEMDSFYETVSQFLAMIQPNTFHMVGFTHIFSASEEHKAKGLNFIEIVSD